MESTFTKMIVGQKRIANKFASWNQRTKTIRWSVLRSSLILSEKRTWNLNNDAEKCETEVKNTSRTRESCCLGLE